MTTLRRCRAREIAFLLCCLLLLRTGYAQQANGSTDTVYHLHGMVVNGDTGKPLARSLVESADRRLATMTDSEGRFAIDVSVPASRSANAGMATNRFGLGPFAPRLTLVAQKPGYIQPMEPTLVTLDDTLSATEVKLKLMSAAVITGHVSAASTDSAANVRVSLLLHQVGSDGRRIWTQLSSFSTNAHGEFRFANLRPGEYTAMTDEWGVTQPLQQEAAADTQHYPPTFYGDESSLEAAVKLHLHYGDAVQAELHIHPATYYRITVPVTNSSSTSAVNVRVLNGSPLSGFRLTYNQRVGAVEGSLPDGHYTLLLTSFVQQPGPGQSQQSFGVATLHVSGAAVNAASVALAPAGKIPIQVHAQFNDPSTSQSGNGGTTRLGSSSRIVPMDGRQAGPLVQLMLQSEDASGNYMSVASLSGDNSELTLQNVPPGLYFVHAQAFRGYVASMTSGVTDLLQQPLAVGDNGTATPIDVTLRDDTPKLSGTVTNVGDPLPQQIYVLLLPLDETSQFTESFAGADGKFSVPNLAPGSYRLLAFSGRQHQLAYRDAEVMQHFDGKGSVVTAAAGQEVHAEVPLLDDSFVGEN